MNSLQTSITSVKVDGHVNYTLFIFHSCMTQILLFGQISKDSGILETPVTQCIKMQAMEELATQKQDDELGLSDWRTRVR